MTPMMLELSENGRNASGTGLIRPWTSTMAAAIGRHQTRP